MTSGHENAVSRVSDAARLQLLVDAVVDYAIYMLDAGGHIASWNSGAQRIKGYTADEIIGRHLSVFYTPEDAAAGATQRGLETAARTGRFEAEGWRVRKDGSRFWASIVIDAIRDERGELLGFAKVTRDITERRNAQLALQQAQEQLAQAQKLESLGRLTGGVAHDFNNLLMIMLGHARTIRAMVGDDPRGLRAIEAIEHAAKRGEALTRQLLTFARRQHLEPERLQFKAWIEAFAQVLSQSLGGGVRLATAIEPDLSPVEVDAGELELALLNLAVNARDAMPEGGAITIAARNVAVRRGELPREELEGAFVALSVADTGTGIPDDVLPKIFDPFFTTKPPDKGTGLGLSQAYGFAVQSNGAVTVESSPGAGTRITLYLPRAEGPAREEVRPVDAPEPFVGRTALLVEDSLEVATVSAELLEQLGFRVVSVRSADAALEALEVAPFDLVVSDIVIIGPMDGLALANAVRERWPQLPVLLTTGYSQVVDEAAAHFPILRKPFGIEELRRATARLMGAARGRTERPNGGPGGENSTGGGSGGGGAAPPAPSQFMSAG